MWFAQMLNLTILLHPLSVFTVLVISQIFFVTEPIMLPLTLCDQYHRR